MNLEKGQRKIEMFTFERDVRFRNDFNSQNFREVESKESITTRSKDERIEELETLLAAREIEIEELHLANVGLNRTLESNDRDFARSLVDLSAGNNSILSNERSIQRIEENKDYIFPKKQSKSTECLEGFYCEREEEFDQSNQIRLMQSQILDLREKLEQSDHRYAKLLAVQSDEKGPMLDNQRLITDQPKYEHVLLISLIIFALFFYAKSNYASFDL